MDKLKKKAKYIINNLGYYSKPDFIIFGVEKAGSRGLYDTLSTHSNLVPSFKKEVHYFDKDSIYQRGKLSDYYHFFPLPHKVKNKLTFEATPGYIFFEKVPERIYNFSPNIKLIAILRNPVERAFSAWQMYHLMNPTKHPNFHDPRDFKEVITYELEELSNNRIPSGNGQILRKGLYAEQLERWFKVFPRENFHFIESLSFLKNTDENISEICSFLKVPYEKLHVKIGNKGNSELIFQYSEEIQLIREFYSKHNSKLFELLGKKFDWN
jgi:hypothetical protein